MDEERKALSDITRKDWVAFHWQECTEMGDNDRMFLRSFRKTPDEAAQAAEDWDRTAEERGFGE
jgi:hypothetical protein